MFAAFVRLTVCYKRRKPRGCHWPSRFRWGVIRGPSAASRELKCMSWTRILFTASSSKHKYVQNGKLVKCMGSRTHVLCATAPKIIQRKSRVPRARARENLALSGQHSYKITHLEPLKALKRVQNVPPQYAQGIKTVTPRRTQGGYFIPSKPLASPPWLNSFAVKRCCLVNFKTICGHG